MLWKSNVGVVIRLVVEDFQVLVMKKGFNNVGSSVSEILESKFWRNY